MPIWFQVAQKKQLALLQKMEAYEPAQSTCNLAHLQDQHAAKSTVRHFVKGRPALIFNGDDNAKRSANDEEKENKDTPDHIKSVSELRQMFSKFGK